MSSLAETEQVAQQPAAAMRRMPNHQQIADARPTPCKVCGAPSPLFGVVDFHKSCIEAQGRRLAYSGYPVYYRRCPQCAFTFTTAFDTWDWDAFHANIYNDDYIIVDPDFAETRPAGGAALIASTFAGAKDSLRILDYGGGNGVFSSRLRDAGFCATTYDPFSEFNQLPAERFDLITCFEVLEHVPTPQTAIETMVSLLQQPGAAIMFSTLLQPKDFESIRLNWWYAGPRNGHVSLYSSQSLARLFQPHGLRVASFNDNLHIAYGQKPPFAAHLRIPE